LEKSIKYFAKDISTKYLSPPETTDFAIMFLPIEGLYAEVARIPGLLEILQREYKITIAGPSNLAAMLNSLQMGFKTLAIEKRSSEVWKILGAVKTEFNKFGDILETAKKRINQASNDIDQLVGTRTRVMQRKLKEVEELPMSDSTLILEDSNDEDIDSDDSLN
ncbi:MAG: DNA recombination protein RmuC, partial [Elusimicrobia bacterium]|nr:DNA recombination protein RmuC [Elusimicrobiota bacterium]